MYERHVRPALVAALADTPVVILDGPRQSGKTTLARTLSDPSRYVTLDDPGTLAAAASDPAGFVAGLPHGSVIDEVQRVAGLLLSIKASIDTDRRPGRFLVTGSARSLSLPAFADALVGRAELHTLWPLSQGELSAAVEGFIDACFDEATVMAALPTAGRAEILGSAARGGFPEAVRRSGQRRDDWFRNYLNLILQREVRDLSAIEGLTSLPDMLTFLATGAGQPLNVATLASGIGLPASTAQRYLSLLEAVFLVHRLPAWSANERARIVRRPKIYLADSGMLAHLLGHGGKVEERSAGPLLETFVVNELMKQVTWSRLRPTLTHFRTHTGSEVDVVVGVPDGRVVGIEVKATATPTPRDTRGLRLLAEMVGDRFVRGIVLCNARGVIPFAERIHAMPIDALWTMRASPQVANTATP